MAHRAQVFRHVCLNSNFSLGNLTDKAYRGFQLRFQSLATPMHTPSSPCQAVPSNVYVWVTSLHGNSNICNITVDSHMILRLHNMKACWYYLLAHADLTVGTHANHGILG